MLNTFYKTVNILKCAVLSFSITKTYTNLTTFNQKHIIETPDFCKSCRQQLRHFVQITILTVGYQHEVTCFHSIQLHGCHENNAVSFLSASVCLFLGPVMYKHSLCQLNDDKTHYSLKQTFMLIFML